MDAEIRARLAAEGHAGPFRFCSADDAEAMSRLLTRAKNVFFARDRLLRLLSQDRTVLSHVRWGRGRWLKGMFATDSLTFDLGVAGPILDPVRAALGDDVLLCGSILINQRPGDGHAWHVDAEQSRWGGLNVWLALRNVTPDSALKLVPGSQAYGEALADLLQRGEIDPRDDDAVLAAARRFDPRARIEIIAPKPGQFVVFDGLAWHSSHNYTGRKRSSLLLQYCRSDQVVAAPKQTAEGWRWDGPPGPCALASGRDISGGNTLTSRPFGQRRLVLKETSGPAQRRRRAGASRRGGPAFGAGRSASS